MLFYIATYVVMLVAAFGAVTAVSGPSTSGSPFDAYRGLGKRSPLVAGTLAVLMLGMSGMPLTSGFIGKFQVFSAAWGSDLGWLVIVGLVASVAAFYFYLRLIVLMYFGGDDETASSERVEVLPSLRLVFYVAVAATIFLGIFPSPLLDLISGAV